MWFLLALVAGLTFAVNRLLIRSVFTKTGDPIIFGAIHELLAGLLLLPIGLLFFSLPQSPQIWIALAVGIFLIFLTDLFGFLALQTIEASLLQIVNQLRHVVVLIGAYFFFTEAITLIKVVSIFFIIFGILVALKSKSKFEMSKGVFYAFLSTVCIAFALLCIKMASVDVSPVFSAPLGLMISGILITTLLTIKKETIKFPSTHRKELFIAAGLFAVFEISLFTALAIGEASKVTPVTQSSMIFTLIGGYLFLNERSHIKQKIFGGIFIVVGIILMYFV